MKPVAEMTDDELREALAAAARERRKTLEEWAKPNNWEDMLWEFAKRGLKWPKEKENE